MYYYLLNGTFCANEPLIFFSPPSPFQQLIVIWENTGPGIALETLTLATLGWWLFTTAAACVCTEREGTANPGVLTLPRPREEQMRMHDGHSYEHASHV